MVNMCVLIGRVGKDPETKPYGDGKTMAKFSLATSDGFGDKEKTDWHQVVFFGKPAETIAQHVKKGSLLYVQGRISYSSRENEQGVMQYFTQIIGTNFRFVGGKKESAVSSAPEEAQQPTQPTDDSLPF